MESSPGTVAALVQAAPTSATVTQFIKQLQLAKVLTSEQARLWRTAVRRVAKEIRDGEPDSASWMLNNLDTLAERIAGTDKLSTARTYRSRAEAALSRFVSWRKNPIAFAAEVQHAEPRTTHAIATKTLSTCPLGPNRVFEYLSRTAASRAATSRESRRTCGLSQTTTDPQLRS